MKKVTKTVSQYEVGDLVMLVKDARFGGPKKKNIVRVTGKQEADGFFTGDVITGTFYPKERFHWANVRLLTSKEVKDNKKRFIKSLYLGSSDIEIVYSNKKIIMKNDWGDETRLSMSEAKQLAGFVNSL